jgi:hypothetical protein
MAQIIRVRDVLRARTHAFRDREPVLRVPYANFKPRGPVSRNGDRIGWEQDGQRHLGRYTVACLGHCLAGERVLVRLHSPGSIHDDWWLCEVQPQALTSRSLASA